MVLYPKLRVEVPECAVVELLSVVRNEYSGYPVLTDMFLQTKFRMFLSVIVAKASASTYFVK